MACTVICAHSNNVRKREKKEKRIEKNEKKRKERERREKKIRVASASIN
jgi:hypothetical protein